MVLTLVTFWFIPENSTSRRLLNHSPRVLSLDGGGIRGLSSLLILKEIMDAIRRKTQNTQNATPPRPCEYFDLIGGTSTGGLIAIMLGRLRMVSTIRKFC